MAGLSVGQPTSDQATTQNPQTAPTQTIGASTQSGGVQPGTSTSLLTDSQGVNLQTRPLTTVSLATTTPSQTSSTTAAKPAQHHMSPALFIIPVALVVIAAALFWAMSRSAKSTTD